MAKKFQLLKAIGGILEINVTSMVDREKINKVVIITTIPLQNLKVIKRVVIKIPNLALISPWV